MDSSVYGISWARILEWVDISFSIGSYLPRDRMHLLHCQADSLSLILQGSLVKYQLNICALICFWFLDSVPLVYVSGFMTIPYCFGYYSFVIQFVIRKCAASSFVLSKDYFGQLEFSVVLYKFKDFFFNLLNNAIGILIGITLT